MIFRFHIFIIFEKILRFQNLELFLPVSKCFKKVPLFLSFLVNPNFWNLSGSNKRFSLLIKYIWLEIISRPSFQQVPIVYLLGLVRLICVTIENFVLFTKNNKSLKNLQIKYFSLIIGASSCYHFLLFILLHCKALDFYFV